MTDTTAKPTRTKAPGLIFSNPDCPVCGAETSFDDTFYCESCGIHWPDPHNAGEWLNDDAEQCPATHQPFVSLRGSSSQYVTVRCLLDAGHDQAQYPHRDEYWINWTDATAVNGKTAETVDQ